MKQWLKEAREKTGFSQSVTANKAGITVQYYNYIENGKRGVPVETAKKIAAVLGFDWQLFYPDEPAANAPAKQ